MPDWRAIVRARLTDAGLRPTSEIDVVEELAQHVEDRYAQWRADGLCDEEATARSLQELDGQELIPELLEILPREPQ
jgi:hypothetical protein